MASVLMIHPNKCTGCRSCELACAFTKESQFRPRPSRYVTGPLVGKRGKPGAGSPDRENPYDVLFA